MPDRMSVQEIEKFLFYFTIDADQSATTAIQIIRQLLEERSWQPIETAYLAYQCGTLRPCQVILTQHKDDLYPVAAYVLDLPKKLWYRAVDGPEDIYIPGGNEPLHRSPTHWKLLPESPFVDAARKGEEL